jgi:hypothetical protein
VLAVFLCSSPLLLEALTILWPVVMFVFKHMVGAVSLPNACRHVVEKHEHLVCLCSCSNVYCWAV